jgi:hypothetical protein
MKKLLLSFALALSLSGCAAYGPGEDDYGRILQGNGEDVLNAVRNYMDDTSHQPANLQVLIPKYLKALPAEPNIQYDPKNAILVFVYDQQGRAGLHVTCHALVGQLQWVCV